ncbi:MAG: 50S ribosomal protein L9 [Eubacterium sp.]
MEIILLEDVKTLGKKGQIVKVNDGYARNFIIPKKLGVEATNKNMNDLKLQKANEAKVAQEKLEAARKLKEEVEKTIVVIKVKTGEKGRLFGTVSNKEIALEMKSQFGIDLDKKKIVISDAIKTLGYHNVIVKLHPEVVASVKVNVVEA